MSDVSAARHFAWTAITRGVSPALGRCELTHLERTPIDVGMARAQHAWYEAVLESLGCRLVRLPADPDLPDSVFVEDTAVVLDEVAILTRPGAPSRRPETAAMDQLGRLLKPHGYTVRPVSVSGCLHLKSAATRMDGDRLLANPAWVDPAVFGGWKALDVDPEEPFAANVLALDDQVISPDSFPRTRRRLEAAGVKVHLVDMEEIQKAEGAVTCCSLVFRN